MKTSSFLAENQRQTLALMLWKVVATAILFLLLSPGSSVAQVEIVRASAELPSLGMITYGAKNLVDRNYKTAWCANVLNHGGSDLTIEMTTRIPIDGFGLINGYAKNAKAYLENDRIQQIKIYDSSMRIIAKKQLKDNVKPQWIALPESITGKITLVIGETYKGSKHRDVCLTEIIFDQSAYSAVEFVLSFHEQDISRARTANLIKQIFEGFFVQYYPSNREGPHAIQKRQAFWNSLKLITSKLDKPSLRLILDMSFYARNFREALDAELMEGLRDQIIQYFEHNPEVVVQVFGDEQQLMRERIIDAYVLYIDPYSEEQLRQLMVRRPTLKKLSDMIQKAKR